MIVCVIVSFLNVNWWTIQNIQEALKVQLKLKKKRETIYQHLMSSYYLPVIMLLSLHSSSCLAIISLFFKWRNWSLEGVGKRLRLYHEWFVMLEFYFLTVALIRKIKIKLVETKLLTVTVIKYFNTNIGKFYFNFNNSDIQS